MTNLDNYRSTGDYREILRILQKATLVQDNFLWHSHALGRNIIPIHYFEIDFVAREVVLYFAMDRFRIETQLPLYVKLNYRASVFKITEYRCNTNSVHFGFPFEIKTVELREFPRIKFQPNQNKSVGLTAVLSSEREIGNEIFVRALDISRYGLGLIISEHNRSFLKNNRFLWVSKLGDYRLAHPLLAEVLYINHETDSKLTTRKQKELKVGIKISGIFPTEAYNHFIQ
jgi:hypothetical protein